MKQLNLFPWACHGAGDGALNKCRSFAAQHVSNPAAPVVKACCVVFLEGPVLKLPLNAFQYVGITFSCRSTWFYAYRGFLYRGTCL